jgi:hypothetical protein
VLLTYAEEVELKRLAERAQSADPAGAPRPTTEMERAVSLLARICLKLAREAE